MIQIRCYGPLREVLTQAALEAQAPLSARQVLQWLAWRYPALGLFDASGRLAPHIAVLVEGKNIWALDGLETKIAPPATLALVHPIEGG